MAPETTTIHSVPTGDTSAVSPIRSVPKDSGGILRRIELASAGLFLAGLPVLVWIVVTYWNFH